MTRFRSAVVSLLLASSAYAAEIVLPASALERDAPVTAVFRTSPQATGKGTLAIRWTDSYGRVVEDRSLAVELADETEISFPLDVRRAVAMQNQLEVRLDLEGVDKAGKADSRHETARLAFIAKPPDRRWWDYQIVMWQQHTPEVFGALKSFGITAGQYSGRAMTPPQFLLSNNLRWYAENIATDFYAEYHRYRRDRKQNWSYLEAKALYQQDPSGIEAFKRHPSLSDPAWLRKVEERLAASARFHSQFRPLFYSLADESGIADLSAYWDFDFSDHSLAAMREWLKERYASLAALNAQWGTNFPSWDRVVPETTNQAMKRSDNNFSSWSDHKEWMDVAFARALKAGADAVNAVDPDAYVSIGGAQMPGWGGYDYYRLTRALSALEPYDIGNNVEIIRSLSPETVLMTTAFAKGPWEKHRVWYELLHGSRGMILWDEKSEYVGRNDLAPGERGRETRPYYNELRSGLGALVINSVRQSDPVAIHYSQPSMRIEWMLAQKPKGAAWVDRTSSTERMDSQFMRLRESWCRMIEDAGLQYSFVASQQIESGELIRSGYRVLILPRSTALSAREAAEIRAFAAQGGVVIADGIPGRYDDHARELSAPQLGELETSGRMIRVQFDSLNYHQHRLIQKEGPAHGAVQKLLADAGITPEFRVTDASGKPPVGVELHRFRNGGITILALHTNPQLRVDELGPPEFKSNERFEKPQTVTLTLPGRMPAWNLKTGKDQQSQQSLTLAVDPYEPTLIALAPATMPELDVSAPAAVKRGQTVTVGMRFRRPSPADRHVIRVECVGPDGKTVPQYSGNLLAAQGVGAHSIPVALNDAVGNWMVRVTDILSGQSKSVTIHVE